MTITAIKISNKIVEIKFFMDISIAFLTIVNFALLVVTASDKIRTFIPLGTLPLVLILVPSAFILIIVMGWFLDKVVNYQSTYYKTQMKRNPQIIEILDRVKNIEKNLEDKK